MRAKLRSEWLNAALYEEFHARMAKENGPLNDGTSGYHASMRDYHKDNRLAIEAELRRL